MKAALEVFDVWPLTFPLCLCVKTVFITPHVFLMQSETEYSFFTVVGSYGKQDTWASIWTFHFVLFFFSLKCAKIRIDHGQEGLVGDSKIFFVVARQKIFSFVSNCPSFSFLESALCVIVPLVWVDTELWRCQRSESLTVNAWLLKQTHERDLLF